MKTRRHTLHKRSLALRMANKDLTDAADDPIHQPRDGLTEATKLRLFHGGTSRRKVRPVTKMYTDPNHAKLTPQERLGIPYSK